MTWVMTIAAGVALGFFLVQFLSKNNRMPGNNEAAQAEQAGQAEAPAEPKRLHRSRTNRQIAGVCGGIAEYLNADASGIRLATIILMFGFGTGLLAYLVCALVLPEE